MLHTFHLPDLRLESGATLPSAILAYTDSAAGQPIDAYAGKPVVWIVHALTGSADPQAWWPGLVGPGCRLDPAEQRIVCVNLLGSCYGSTGPLTQAPLLGRAWFHDFPRLTIRDHVAALDLLRQYLHLDHLDLLIGGSLGGQVALEWAIERPSVPRHLVLLATNARHSAWGIAWNETQRAAIRLDPTWTHQHPDAGLAGLAIARQQAMLSYRTWQQYEATQQDPFDPQRPELPRRAASYQQHQGRKLTERFNAFSYLNLTHLMDSHDVARGRASAPAALAQVQARTRIVSISSDVLFPPAEQAFLAQHIPGAELVVLESPFGHDGFLTETEAIAPHLPDLQPHPSLQTS